MKPAKMNQIKKIAVIICSAAAILSLTIFIPYIRELILLFGEKLIRRPLTHAVWHARFIRWEIEFLIIASVMFLIQVFSLEKLNSEKVLQVLSWSFIVIFSLMLLITACQSDDIWVDETFSLGLARHSFKDLIKITAKDVHPPLYYMILKIAMLIFPGSICAAKIVSAIPVIAILCIANHFFSKEFSIKYGLLFNILLASTYSVLIYAVEIRMYSWCLLFCCLCCIASFYIINKGDWKDFLIYVFFAECGAYSQYWTAFGLAINFSLICLVSFINNKKNLTKIIISVLLGIILYLPWVKVVIAQVKTVSQDYWIGPVTFKGFIDWNLSVMPSKRIIMLVILAVLFYYFIKKSENFCINNFRSQFLIICLITPFLLILCATLISIIMRPVFQAKYVFPLTIFIFFFLVISLHEIKISTKALQFLVLLGFIFSIENSISIFKSEKNLAVENKYFERTMQEKITEDTVFVFSKDIDSHIPACIAYMYPNNRIYDYDISEMWASAILYDRKNLIQSIKNEKRLCLVIPLEEKPLEEFAKITPIVIKFSTYAEHKFYFLNK